MPPSLLLRVGRVALTVAAVGALVAVVSRPAGRPAKRRRVVIVGAGFGGLAAATALATDPLVDLTVIDATGHHLFQPLLYQVATASLSPSDIAVAIGGILPPWSRVLTARVVGIDAAARCVRCDETDIAYDDLVVATGSQAGYFGHAEWAGFAPSLKSLHDALALRTSILEIFSRATRAEGAERERLLTFVLIGGGPTGVELAGAIAELSRDLARQGAAPAEARILLIDAGQRILSSFAPSLSDYAAASLRAMGVEVRTGTSVSGIEDGVVSTAEGSVAAATVIWTAGTEATPVATWLGVAASHGGRVAVGPDLRLAGHPEIAIIGDAAEVRDGDGKPLPGLAPVAKQQGEYVARTIRHRLRGRRRPGRFRYRDYGTLATIGRNRAVAELGQVRLRGFVAWALWACAHIFFLIGFRNRFMVIAQWAFAWATNARPGRLIGHSPTPPRAVGP